MMESNGDNQIVQEFLVEGYENLDNLERELVTLESHPDDTKALGSIFRMIHTIKGTCGFLGFGKLEEVAHVGENLLSRLRDGELKLTPEMTTALLKAADAIRQMLVAIEANGSEGDRNDLELIATLTRIQQAGSFTPADQSRPQIIVSKSVDEALLTPAPIGSPKNVSANAESAAEQPAAPSSTDAMANAASGKSQASESTIRVDVGLLDKLMNLVGELVLARNQILQFTNSLGHNGLLATGQRLNLITTELQEGVMKTRMQPIGNVWTKFPRTVRDVATQCGKQVRIEMEGRENGTRQDHHRSHQRPADAHGAQRGGPRRGKARNPSRSRQTGRRTLAPPRLSRRRTGQHRNQR